MTTEEADKAKSILDAIWQRGKFHSVDARVAIATGVLCIDIRERPDDGPHTDMRISPDGKTCWLAPRRETLRPVLTAVAYLVGCEKIIDGTLLTEGTKP